MEDEQDIQSLGGKARAGKADRSKRVRKLRPMQHRQDGARKEPNILPLSMAHRIDR